MPACPQGYISLQSKGSNEIRGRAAHKCLMCSLSRLHLFFYYLGGFFPTDVFFPFLSIALSLSSQCNKCDLSHTHTHTRGVTSPVPVCHISPGSSPPDSTGGGQGWLHSGHAPQGKSMTFP